MGWVWTARNHLCSTHFSGAWLAYPNWKPGLLVSVYVLLNFFFPFHFYSFSFWTLFPALCVLLAFRFLKQPSVFSCFPFQPLSTALSSLPLLVEGTQSLCGASKNNKRDFDARGAIWIALHVQVTSFSFFVFPNNKGFFSLIVTQSK